MILRKSALSCVRTNICQCRSISMNSQKFNEKKMTMGPFKAKDLPSRKLFQQLTEKDHLDERLTRSGRKPFELMQEKPIVVKKFFISEIESEEFKYPELLSHNDLDRWKKTNEKISKCLPKPDETIEIDQIDALRKLNLWGYNVPKEFGGQNYTHTELSLANETEIQNIGIAIALNAHRLVCEAITINGNNEQLTKYLPKLANGEFIATTAFQEWNSVEQTGLNTRAEYDEENENWCLNGTKSFVVNGNNANLFLVLVQTQVSDRLGDMKDSLTMFLVDESLPGIEIHQKDETIGLTNGFQSKVSFNNVLLSKDAILSLPGSGQYIEKIISMNARLNQGLLNLIQMKSILQYMVDMATSIEQASTSGEGNQAVTLRSAIGKYACSIYALESMLYLTTGIMDKYNNTNVDLETAIFKVYSQDELLNMTTDLLDIVDSRVTLSVHPMNNFIRNAFQLKFSEPKNDLKLHIGREGIQYRLLRFIEEVKIKNNKEFLMKNFQTDAQLDIYEAEMRAVAKEICDSIELLRLKSSSIIDMEVRERVARDSEIQSISDAAVCIYASYACLLRGDRSLKLKLPDAQGECVIAQTVSYRHSAKVKRLMQFIDDGPVKTFEKYHELVASQQLDNKFPQHPLTRLF